MAAKKDKSLKGALSADTLFGSKKQDKIEPAAEKKATPKKKKTAPAKARKNAIPENFEKVNYIIDPDTARLFKTVAVSKGESLNVLADTVLKAYALKELKKLWIVRIVRIVRTIIRGSTAAVHRRGAKSFIIKKEIFV